MRERVAYRPFRACYMSGTPAYVRNISLYAISVISARFHSSTQTEKWNAIRRKDFRTHGYTSCLCFNAATITCVCAMHWHTATHIFQRYFVNPLNDVCISSAISIRQRGAKKKARITFELLHLAAAVEWFNKAIIR